MARIRTKITGLFIFIALFSAVVIAVLTLWRSRGIVEEEAIQKMMFQTQFLSEGFEKDLQKLRSIANGIESILYFDMPDEGINPASIHAYKDELEKHYLTFGKKLDVLSMWMAFNPDLIEGPHSVGFFDQDRDGVFQQEEPFSISDRDLTSSSMRWWTGALEYGEIWTEPYYWEEWDMELISYSKAVYKDSVFLGCLGSDFDFSQMRRKWTDTKLYTSGFVSLMNENLNFIIHPLFEGENVRDTHEPEVVEAFQRMLTEQSSGYYCYHYQGQDRVLAFQQLSNKWILMGVVPIDEIYGPVHAIANSLLIILISVLVFSIIIAFLFSKKITSPIRVLVNLFNTAENGNLSVRSAIQTNDEFKELGDRFNFFMNEMQGMIKRLKDQEQELIKERDRAEESDRLKTAFLGNLSHEIRTPLYGIVGYSELLSEQGYGDEERAHFIEVIQQNNDKLLKFIDDILIFSQLEQGLVHCEKLNINFQSLWKTIIEDVQTNLNNNKPNVELLFEVSDINSTSVVLSDTNLLSKVVHILMDNALKFTHQGTVLLTVYSEDKKWGFSVHDSGVGIPEEYQSLIFKKFYKYVSDTSVLYEGVGMGLSIALDLVRLLDGEIVVNSKRGEGSTFSVEFPMIENTTTSK
ncbi:MAG: sensor histidine kinase [Marinilabiliaceae bacterium]|nr:sensor histidine kinase [Marinilabiliaceae bacterium]